MNTYFGKYILILFIVVHAGFQLTAQRTSRPNIIVFLVDDMGWQDTSVPFWEKTTPANRHFHTPHMERLAAEGMKFTNAYATPVCTPTRVSLMTGMNAARHRVTNWTSPYPNMPTGQTDEQFADPDWNYNGWSNESLPHTLQATTLPSLLKDVGYLTILVGKAHFGPSGMPGSNPHNMGFMINIAGHAGGRPQSYLGEENYGNQAGKANVHAVPDMQEYYGSSTFLTEALTREAIKSITTPVKTHQPFFLLLSHYAVHDPYDADKRFVQKYLDAGLSSQEARYAALVEGMDKSLGDLMHFLREQQAEKNTIIIFMSDNGGLSHYGRDGQRHTHNAPLRSGKGSVYEGGIREPMIVKWPGRIKPGTIAHQYVIIEDFFPSLLAMAQVSQYKTSQKIDGISFLPIFKNPLFSDDSRVLIWHFPHKWTPDDGPGINYYSAVRKGCWKLVYQWRTGRKELYNLNDDIGEQHNRENDFPAIAEGLAATLFAKLKDRKALLPMDRKTGRPVHYATEYAGEPESK